MSFGTISALGAQNESSKYLVYSSWPPHLEPESYY